MKHIEDGLTEHHSVHGQIATDEEIKKTFKQIMEIGKGKTPGFYISFSRNKELDQGKYGAMEGKLFIHNLPREIIVEILNETMKTVKK